MEDEVCCFEEGFEFGHVDFCGVGGGVARVEAFGAEAEMVLVCLRWNGE